MLWLKSFHLIAIICWFAGIFYLPRLFVYHSMADDAVSQDRFKIMERKLYFGIMLPSMIATVGLGVWLAALSWPYYQSSGWFHAKMLIVFFLIGYHHMCGAHVKRFQRNENKRSHTYFRVFNEIPVVLLIGAVILAVVKPF